MDRPRDEKGTIMTKITLTNDFHSTEINLRPRDRRLSPSQVRRAQRRLCGITTCTCGGVAGERGHQEFEGDAVYLLAEPDGGATIETE